MIKYNSNTKELLLRLSMIKATITAGAFSDALVGGLNAGMGLMKRRIFNASLDADGLLLGPYVSKAYKKRREAKGRQVANKDLELLGSLRRAIEVVTVDGYKAEIRITHEDLAKIARYLESQVANIRAGTKVNAPSTNPARIFYLSDEEREVVSTTTMELLAQKFDF